MHIRFSYEKAQVIQALRYHFISRPEIRIMIILVNVFALVSIVLYYLRYVGATAFLIGSLLWVILMISFWFVLPMLVYRRAETFRHSFSMNFGDEKFSLEHENGSRSWPWKSLSYFMESPNFFHLYFDSRSFLLVPKSGMKDSDEVQQLRHIISQYVKRK